LVRLRTSDDVIGELGPIRGAGLGRKLNIPRARTPPNATSPIPITRDGRAEGTAMGNTNYVGRVGALAIALGIGAGLAGTPWVAGASPSTAARGQNLSVAANDQTRVQKGTARATAAGTGSVAIVIGSGSSAFAGNGDNNRAFVFGDNSEALAGNGDGNKAIVVGDFSHATAGIGNNNFARVVGNFSTATAHLGNNNTAEVFGDGSTAEAGLGANNTATANGDSKHAVAQGNNQTDTDP
jgi:hypothetical protein